MNGVQTMKIFSILSKIEQLVADSPKPRFNNGANRRIVDEEELLLRIKALLRRAKSASDRVIRIGDVTIDYDALTVTKGGESQTLPPKEFYLLYKLLSSPDKIFTRDQLMDEIWGMESDTTDYTINVHINRLRKRFDLWPEFEIVTVRGLGYKAVKKVE